MILRQFPITSEIKCLWYCYDKMLSLVISAGYEGGDIKGKKHVIFFDNLFKFKKSIYTIIIETSKSSPIGI